VEAVHSAGLQDGSRDDRLYLFGEGAPLRWEAARRQFNRDVVAFATTTEAINAIATPLVGFINHGVLLHDVGAANCLAELLHDTTIASASCVMTTAERKTGALRTKIVDGGAFLSVEGDPVPAEDAVRVAVECWRSHYPVNRPSFHLWLTRLTNLRSWNTGGSSGGVHMCSTEVTAIAPSANNPHEVIAVPPSPGTATQIALLIG
jgi:hypothetical protein